MNPDATTQQKWSDLLAQAVTQPGLILKAYSAFHGYSLGNQLAALLQCHRNGIEPGPIDTYKGWIVGETDCETDSGSGMQFAIRQLTICDKQPFTSFPPRSLAVASAITWLPSNWDRQVLLSQIHDACSPLMHQARSSSPARHCWHQVGVRALSSIP